MGLLELTDEQRELQIKFSNVLNDTGAYNKICLIAEREMGFTVNHDSAIFDDIELFFIEKFEEMKETEALMKETEEANDWSDEPTGSCANPTCRQSIYDGSEYCDAECSNET
jgi:hypothetical protein